MYFVYDYVGLLLMMNMLTIVISHVTCIIPPIGRTALSDHERTERHRRDKVTSTDTVLNWRQYWPKRLENKRFGSDVLMKICAAEEISFKAGTRNVKSMVKALDNRFLQEQQQQEEEEEQ